MRKLGCVLIAVACSGCVTTETVSFRPGAQQEALIRDGNPALVSKKKNSIVLVRPAGRQFQSGGRPVFVVGITNLTNGPLNFLVSNVAAYQTVGDQQADLKVITYEQLVSEENTRQVVAAVLTGVAAGANSYSAAQAGHYNSNSVVQASNGRVYNVSTTGYSPTANVIAQANASAQNDAMIGATVERGRENLAVLEKSVIKDNTILPGEWYGGQLHLSPLHSSDSGKKTYTITLQVGPDTHEITIQQEPTR